MDENYHTHGSGSSSCFLSPKGGIELELDLDLDLDLNLEGMHQHGDKPRFDLQSYHLDYEATPWIHDIDDTTTTSPSSLSQEEFGGSWGDAGYHQQQPPSLSPSAFSSPSSSQSSISQSHSPNHSSKGSDPALSRLNRRRAQNRQSQKQFRERKQKAYDEVVAQVQERDHVICGLREDVADLHRTVVGLRREKLRCLDAVMGLCRGLYEDGLEAPTAAVASELELGLELGLGSTELGLPTGPTTTDGAGG